MRFSYIAALLVAVAYAERRSTGAPESACMDMIHRHPAPPQDGDAPYVITTSTKKVHPGSPVEVTIAGMEANDTIRGIMLQARHGDHIIGHFMVDPDDPLIRTMNCSAAYDTVTHKEHEYEDDRQIVTVTWFSPADFNSSIKFRATVVLIDSVYWVGIESDTVKVTR